MKEEEGVDVGEGEEEGRSAKGPEAGAHPLSRALFLCLSVSLSLKCRGY